MLRILAQMTPEQIDALTFLLLSQQDPQAAAAAAGDQADPLAMEAPWVGDWSAGDLDPDQAQPATAEAPVQNDLLAGWYVFEASATEAVIRNADDPLSSVLVSPGTVLGNLGFVTEIRLDDGTAKVVLSGGDVIVSNASAMIAAEPPEPSGQLSGPPSDIALALAGSVAEELTATEADALSEGMAETAAAEMASDPAAGAEQALSTEAGSDQPLTSGDDGGNQYVQVAAFKSRENAQIAKDILVSDGMTGELRKASLKGSPYHLVVAGPFEPADIKTALTRVNRLGFRDAFIIR
jgi:hypothetical protein